jgi:hypothetical protein
VIYFLFLGHCLTIILRSDLCSLEWSGTVCMGSAEWKKRTMCECYLLFSSVSSPFRPAFFYNRIAFFLTVLLKTRNCDRTENGVYHHWWLNMLKYGLKLIEVWIYVWMFCGVNVLRISFFCWIFQSMLSTTGHMIYLFHLKMYQCFISHCKTLRNVYLVQFCNEIHI